MRSRPPARRRSILIPAALTGAGAVLLLANAGLIPPSRFVLPTCGVLAGALLVATARGGGPRFIAGIALAGASALVLLARLGVLPGLETTWPAILVILGLAWALDRRRTAGGR